MGESILTRKGGGTDASDATASKQDILIGKTAYLDDSGDAQTGVMPNNGAVNSILAINGNYTIPAGYHNGSGKVTQNIPLKVAATYTPTISNQIIGAGQYLSGAQTIVGDLNLNGENIKGGISIFGVQGELGTIKKVANPTDLSVARTGLAGASVGNYALFAGGSTSIYNEYASTVDAYNDSLTKSTPQILSVARTGLAGASVGNYVLFAGGSGRSGALFVTIDVYNSSLVATTTYLMTAKENLAGTSVGNYALFAGGQYNSSSTGNRATVDAYNSSLVRTTPTDLSVARKNLAGTNVGNYALFAGGRANSDIDSLAVDAYDSSLVRTTPTALSVPRSNLAGASVGNYALFAGGSGSSAVDSSTVDAYDSSLVRSIPTALSVAMSESEGASVGNYALFAKVTTGAYGSPTINAYNESLARSILTGLSVTRMGLVGTSVGNYALFAGGYESSSSRCATVDAYKIVK